MSCEDLKTAYVDEGFALRGPCFSSSEAEVFPPSVWLALRAYVWGGYMVCGLVRWVRRRGNGAF